MLEARHHIFQTMCGNRDTHSSWLLESSNSKEGPVVKDTPFTGTAAIYFLQPGLSHMGSMNEYTDKVKGNYNQDPIISQSKAHLLTAKCSSHEPFRRHFISKNHNMKQDTRKIINVRTITQDLGRLHSDDKHNWLQWFLIGSKQYTE